MVSLIIRLFSTTAFHVPKGREMFIKLRFGSRFKKVWEPLLQKNEYEGLKWMTMNIIFLWHLEEVIVTYNAWNKTPESIFQITRGQWGTFV